MSTSNEKNEIGSLTFDSIAKELGVSFEEGKFKIPLSLPSTEFKLLNLLYIEKESARNNFNWICELILNQIESAKDFDEAKNFCCKMREVLKQVL